MYKNQKGFALIEGLLIVVVMAALGFIGWKAYTASQDKENSQRSTTANDVITAKEGSQTVQMLPGKTTVKLPSGATLMFSNSSGPDSVPDFVFGDKYDLSDTPNYVPIKQLTKTYDNGYQYTLTNKGCHTERKFDTDVEITVVAYCPISIETQKVSVPAINRTSLTKQLYVSEKGAASPSVQSDNPYLYVKPDRTRLTKTIDGQKVYLAHGEWDIEIITNFGVGKLKYTAEELHANQSKSVTIGGSKVEISNITLTCTAPYGPATGCHASLGEKGAVYDQFNFEVHATSAGSQEVKILDYQD